MGRASTPVGLRLPVGLFLGGILLGGTGRLLGGGRGGMCIVGIEAGGFFGGFGRALSGIAIVGRLRIPIMQDILLASV